MTNNALQYDAVQAAIKILRLTADCSWLPFKHTLFESGISNILVLLFVRNPKRKIGKREQERRDNEEKEESPNTASYLLSTAPLRQPPEKLLGGRGRKKGDGKETAKPQTPNRNPSPSQH